MWASILQTQESIFEIKGGSGVELLAGCAVSPAELCPQAVVGSTDAVLLTTFSHSTLTWKPSLCMLCFELSETTVTMICLCGVCLILSMECCTGRKQCVSRAHGIHWSTV